jgi:ABC-type glutathione transport system ATPase component
VGPYAALRYSCSPVELLGLDLGLIRLAASADSVASAGVPDSVVRDVLASAGATNLAALDTAPACGYDGNTDLSGGPRQRIALAQALAAVTLRAGVVRFD